MKAHPNVDTFVKCVLITPSRHGYRGVTFQPHLFLLKEADQGPQIRIVKVLDLLGSNFKDHQQLSLLFDEATQE